ncbi:hypothetical protein DL96DRAFT_1586749 [Flagelloscypha sp. PMI_526]|nr:hypothetical protein DL96DRAFT_1586749 [Flagelloscypha sp. PMI_526]
MPSLKSIFRKFAKSSSTVRALPSTSASPPTRLSYSTLEPRLPCELFDLVMKAFFSSEHSVADRRNLEIAAKNMHLTQAKSIEHCGVADPLVLSSGELDAILEEGMTTTTSHIQSLSIYIEENDELLVDSMQSFLRAVSPPDEKTLPPTTLFPSLRSLRVHYHNTPYLHILRDSHIPSLPSQISNLQITFSHSSPAVAERMTREYEAFGFTVDVIKSNPFLKGVGTLSVHGASGKFVKHMAARCVNMVGLDVDQQTDLVALKGFVSSVQSFTRTSL